MPNRLPTPDADGKRAYPVPPGPSLLEVLWERLDEITRELMREYIRQETPEDFQHGNGSGCINPERLDWEIGFASLKGEALGLAWAISVIQSPYAPNVDSVRAEAMRRYKEQKRG